MWQNSSFKYLGSFNFKEKKKHCYRHFLWENNLAPLNWKERKNKSKVNPMSVQVIHKDLQEPAVEPVVPPRIGEGRPHQGHRPQSSCRTKRWSLIMKKGRKKHRVSLFNVHISNGISNFRTFTDNFHSYLWSHSCWHFSGGRTFVQREYVQLKK